MAPIGAESGLGRNHRRCSAVTSRSGLAAAVLLTFALGCSSDADQPVGGRGAAGETGGNGGTPETGPPSFTEEEWALLATLSPSVLPAPPADITNQYADDEAAALLGRKLFFAPVFSGRLLTGDNNGGPGTLGMKGDTGKVSCASCHLPESDFQDTRSPSAQISLAAAWGRRKAPSLLDIGQATLVTWDGRRDTLYNQVFAPIESVAEMNSSRLFAAQQVFAHYRDEYEAVFGPMPPLDDTSLFPPLDASATGCTPAGSVAQPDSCEGTFRGSPGDQAEYDSMTEVNRDAVTRVIVNFGKAVAAYERRLSCGAGRFDAWVAGESQALSASEQRGAQVFIGAGECIDCHSGPFFSDNAFHNVGLMPGQVAAAFIDLDDQGAAVGLAAALADPLNAAGPYSDGDDGRLPRNVTAAHSGAFRTPMLRCASRRPSFMHTAQLRTLEGVVDFFDRGGDAGGYPGTSELAPLSLTAQQKADLVAFLKSLDGPGADAALREP
jgi:cytochrome c peroxidase